MKEGARFTNSPDLPKEIVPKIIDLLASIVRYDNTQKNKKRIGYN